MAVCRIREDIHAAIAVADAQYDQKKVMVQNLVRRSASGPLHAVANASMDQIWH